MATVSAAQNWFDERSHDGERWTRAELTRFLKQCRDRLQPDDVGLESRGVRRVVGLRREEVAGWSASR